MKKISVSVTAAIPYSDTARNVTRPVQLRREILIP